jgi:hypothetical protein
MSMMADPQVAGIAALLSTLTGSAVAARMD